MAELLVKAKPHWMDNLEKEEIDKLDVDKKRSYEARSQIGDIIVVRPDGWKWGKEECLPNYVVVKIPDLKIEDAKKYQEHLMGERVNEGIPGVERYVIKYRKYQIPKAVIDNAKQQSLNSLEVTIQQKYSFITSIVDKSK